jgi:hypothetical protein
MSSMPGKSRSLYGVELRYALTFQLFQHGAATVPELIDALHYHHFAISGRASKAVSDALRWEIAHGRVRRLARGRYAPAEMPRATEIRIRDRVLALRSEAALIAAEDIDAFWHSLGA